MAGEQVLSEQTELLLGGEINSNIPASNTTFRQYQPPRLQRSGSADTRQRQGGVTVTYDTFLSPHNAHVTSAPASKRTRSSSGTDSAGTGQRAWQRSSSAHRGTGRSVPDQSMPGDKVINRSSSTSTLRSNNPKSRYGSEQHLGSSVTFCNKSANKLMVEHISFSGLGWNDSGLKRSLSDTIACPSNSIVVSSSSTNQWQNQPPQTLTPSEGPRSSHLPVSGTLSCDLPRRMMLSPPAITYDGMSTVPSSPTWGRPENLMLPNSNNFGSSYQLQVRNKSVMVTPRGSFLAVNQSPLEFRESTLSINYPICGDDGEEVSLVYARLEKIPMKDFAAEIRAHLDVEQFLSQAQLMLDIQETNMEEIMECMLHHLLDKEESPTAFHEAKKVIFTNDSAHQLSKTIQCTCSTFGGGYDYDQSWICVLCTAASVLKRHVAIARLRNPANLGRTCQEAWFIILVVTSTKEKGTKNALETGRTFSTLFADMDLRLQLLGARTEDEFKQLMWEHMKELAEEQCEANGKRKTSEDSVDKPIEQVAGPPDQDRCWFARGLRADWRRRIPHYWSDYKDGFCGPHTLHKTVSTTFFLYFACILPGIALGVLYYNNTRPTGDPKGDGHIDVKKVIYSQTIGGLVFAIFGGQPMVILLTTAPLALYTKVIYTICEDWKLDFVGMFACTGLWNSFFLLIYAFTDASKLMKWCTRSTEEIFALFISIALAVDAFKDVVYDFQEYYHSSNCDSLTSNVSNESLLRDQVEFLQRVHRAANSGESQTGRDNSHGSAGQTTGDCLRQNSLLYLLLMLGTVWLGLSLYNFTKTPFLNASKRELLADCALPVSVLLMSFFGSYIFREVKLKKFKLIEGDIFKPAALSNLEWPAILGAMGLGFCLSLLFFMDQNIAASMVNSPDNRMKKGRAYHWDLMVIALLNAFLAFFGLPMVHGALPHSPLHVRAMADVEDRVYQGHVYLKIVCVRETRVTGIFSHILIGLSLLFIEQLKKIPRPVLDGLFLYLAITALHNNQLFERIMLLVTEQAAYPPNHYIRTVPQRKIHLFTFLQLLQLVVLCGFGFAPIPYLKMVFPVLHLVMLPIRHKLVPTMIEKKYLQSLDLHKLLV